MEKRKVALLLLMASLATATLSGCTTENTDNLLADVKQDPKMATTEVVEEEKKVEKKTYKAGEHVFFKRYRMTTGSGYYAEEFTGGQITIPEGYEILDIENYAEYVGKGSQTGGFDVWFIKNKDVEVEPVYNAKIKAYDYSEPGTIVETMDEEKGPELKLIP